MKTKLASFFVTTQKLCLLFLNKRHWGVECTSFITKHLRFTVDLNSLNGVLFISMFGCYAVFFFPVFVGTRLNLSVHYCHQLSNGWIVWEHLQHVHGINKMGPRVKTLLHSAASGQKLHRVPSKSIERLENKLILKNQIDYIIFLIILSYTIPYNVVLTSS